MRDIKNLYIFVRNFIIKNTLISYMSSLSFKQPSFSLLDIFPNSPSLEKEAEEELDGDFVHPRSKELKKGRKRIFKPYNGIFNFLTDRKNEKLYREFLANLEGIVAYNEAVLKHLDGLTDELERMQLRAAYKSNYTYKLRHAKSEVAHFMRKYEGRPILKKIGEAQLNFIDAVFKTDEALQKKVYPDNPDPRTPEFQKALREAYAGFKLED